MARDWPYALNARCVRKAPPPCRLNIQSERRGILKLATRRRRGQCDGVRAEGTDIRDTETLRHEPCSSRTTWRYLSILHLFSTLSRTRRSVSEISWIRTRSTRACVGGCCWGSFKCPCTRTYETWLLILVTRRVSAINISHIRLRDFSSVMWDSFSQCLFCPTA